ncbi:hypothetical protein BV20DRAFT_206456 [Pilatotrama ljubarskyi]|nr:hypothetical protein BV20DRAFT_206456 [Pilatotrama ljubarskyi]
MCRLETEGTKYGCGHYIITRKLRKIDCESQWCYHSRRHRNPCHNCSCDRYYGPDASETITAVRPEFCPECYPFYSQRRR